MLKQRSSSKFKTDVVLELLRGETLESLSRKYGVTMGEIDSWRNDFIENGRQGFKKDPNNSKLAEAQRKIGQLEMEIELIKKKQLIVQRLKGR